MSCMISSPDTIAMIANFIALIGNTGANSFMLELPKETREAFKNCRDNYGYFEANKIARLLILENERAYCSRYKVAEQLTDSNYFGFVCPWSDVLEIDFYNFERVKGNKENNFAFPAWVGGRYDVFTASYMQLFKSLQFYIYQVSEDATANGVVYKGLEALKNAVAVWLCENTELYNVAKWE